METCENHPERKAEQVCMKYQLHFCEACAHCRDPKLYCKHRTACPIWFMDKERKRGRREKGEGMTNVVEPKGGCVNIKN